jgi:serine/threonine protein kinase/pectin methylesterase-like acyl-CoA thioesterase
MSSTAPDILFAGRYRLLEQLGAGGMGAVHKATDTKLDRTVAIKIMAGHLVRHPDALARFQREAKALAKVAHPGIVQAFDTDQDGEQHFLVMEYVAGHSLLELLRAKGRVPPTIAADYTHQAAVALQHAHERGLIHRDVKPHNLLLTPTGQVKVLDLGLARFAQDHLGDTGDAGLTREGAGMGTPDYMAPEQFSQAHRADARSDIYSLGCTLFHLITGRVVFPGTSLAEKTRAHEEQDPPRVEELCPEAPVGLALTIRKMLAKSPAERFQSMREVAEALAPYVAASSISLPEIQKTTNWEGSQLSFHALPTKQPSGSTPLTGAAAQLPRRRSRRVLALLGSAAGLLLLVGGLVSLPFLLPTPRGEFGISTGPQPAAPVRDPNVLTVSKDAKDGAQYDTINGALANVQPGQTVRVLDDATYSESVRLNVEGVTLEAVRGATANCPASAQVGIMISNVPNVTVRGLRIRVDCDGPHVLAVQGNCLGSKLDDLELSSTSATSIGILLVDVGIPQGKPPLIIENCSVSGGFVGIQAVGCDVGTKAARPCQGVVIRNNHVNTCINGLALGGKMNDIQIVGNRVWNCNTPIAFPLELLSESGDLLLANNTLKAAGRCLQINDLGKDMGPVDIRNNLILSEGKTDIAFIGKDSGPLAGLRLDHNWRQVRAPTNSDGSTAVSGRIDSMADQIRDTIDLLSTDPASPDFLRPAKDSPLATQGAGQTDPRLPSYVGAVPPEGVPPWDWERAWKMPKDAQLLTVSKDEKDGGQYRTINDALKAAKPWATVRVVDGGTYEESIVIDKPESQAGILLEAVGPATLEMGRSARFGLAIHGVADIRVTGFRLREQRSQTGIPRTFITASDQVAGLVLQDLDIHSTGPSFGIVLQNARGSMADRIEVRNNRISGTYKGMVLVGESTHVQVAGNIVSSCPMLSLQLDNVTADSGPFLIANNTLYESNVVFRLWEDPPYKEHPIGQAELCNNLLFDAGEADMAFTVAGPDGTEPRHQDPQPLLAAWRFHYNWRDLSGANPGGIIPLAPGDHRFERRFLLSRDPTSPDFLRPAPDSPLATGGAGKDDPSLPIYVGAVPPRGTPAWDWDRTWRARILRKVTLPAAEKKP